MVREAFPLARRELLGGDHDNRDLPPAGAVAKHVEERKPVHFRHHQIEQYDGWRRMVAEP